MGIRSCPPGSRREKFLVRIARRAPASLSFSSIRGMPRAPPSLIEALLP